MSASGKKPQNELVLRVARAIAARRQALGLTQEALAARLELAVKNLQRIEGGRQNLTLVTLDRIALALETTAPALIAAPPPAEATSSAVAVLRVAGYAVRPGNERGRRAASAIPIMTIKAAAGRSPDGANAVEALGWLTPSAPPPAGQFIAKVEGRSMEPRIPRGAIALFGPAASPSHRGRVLLVAHESIDDHDGPFALKLVETRRRGEHTRVTLRSSNPDVAPLAIDDGSVRVIAELVEVLLPREDDAPLPAARPKRGPPRPTR